MSGATGGPSLCCEDVMGSLLSIGNAQNASKVLSLHPGTHIPLCLLLRDTGARLDHRAQLTFGFDGRAIKDSEEWPLLPRIVHVVRFARHKLGAFATLEPKHW